MNEQKEQHEPEQEKASEDRIAVVGGHRRAMHTMALMSALAANGLGPIMVRQGAGDRMNNVDAQIARAGVEAQLAKDAIAAADAKRERKRLKRLKNSEKKA